MEDDAFLKEQAFHSAVREYIVSDVKKIAQHIFATASEIEILNDLVSHSRCLFI